MLRYKLPRPLHEALEPYLQYTATALPLLRIAAGTGAATPGSQAVLWYSAVPVEYAVPAVRPVLFPALYVPMVVTETLQLCAPVLQLPAPADLYGPALTGYDTAAYTTAVQQDLCQAQCTAIGTLAAEQYPSLQQATIQILREAHATYAQHVQAAVTVTALTQTDEPRYYLCDPTLPLTARSLYYTHVYPTAAAALAAAGTQRGLDPYTPLGVCDTRQSSDPAQWVLTQVR
jgi:hypothetical protein